MILRTPNLRFLLLGVLMIVGLCLRLYGIGQPPMDVTGVRQYHGALMARGLYEWLLSGNLDTIPPGRTLEPPFLDFLASCAYAISGGEHLWIPRLLSALFWLVGGVLLYLIARKILSPNAGVFAVAFYLLDPAVVLFSRAFMPDPLMIMLLVCSVFTILRYHEQPSGRRLMVAVAVSSATLFVKPGICFFQVFGAFFALMLYRRGLLKPLGIAHSILFAVLTLIPMGLYYVLFLQGAAAGRIEPEILLSLSYWRGWLWQIDYLVGYVALTGALLGVLLLRPGLPRVLLAGLWGGYLLFGLVFGRHVQTHDYYSLQLIPVIALSLGSAWEFCTEDLWRAASNHFVRAAIVGVLLVALALGAIEHRETLVLLAQQGRGAAFPGRYVSHGTIAGYEGRAEIYREIGEIVDHSPKTIMFAPDYGHSLVYHGRLDGVFLYPESKSVRKDFEALYEAESPRYAIVIKRFAYYPRRVDWGGTGKGKNREDLRATLEKNFGVVANERSYIVFDLKETSGDESEHKG
jgi:hypothetical protein